MSNWVLVFWIFGYGGHPAVIDMPSQAVCEREGPKLDKAVKLTAMGWYCLDRRRAEGGYRESDWAPK